jgi:hypothetical protein
MVKLRCGLRTTLWMTLVMGLSWFPVAWADLDDGLVAYYPFDGNAQDATGNGNDGTVNGATLTADRFGNADGAYDFDGIDDYIDFGNFIPAKDIKTMAVWVKFKSISNGQEIISKSSFNNGVEILFWHNALSYYVMGGNGGSSSIAIDWNTFNINEYYFIAATHEGPNSNMKLYVNGVLVKTNQTKSISDADLMLAGRRNVSTIGGERYFNGYIDNIRIYNRALSECEIKSLYTGNDECNPPPVSCSNEPATYSNETRQAILPCVEIPLYTDINGSSIELTGLYSAVLEIPFGFSEFEAKELNFLEIIEESNPSHAWFNPDSGILDIPRIDMPTIVPLLDGETVPGPTLQCSAKLQQSALRAEVLMLQDFDCNLP